MTEDGWRPGLLAKAAGVAAAFPILAVASALGLSAVGVGPPLDELAAATSGSGAVGGGAAAAVGPAPGGVPPAAWAAYVSASDVAAERAPGCGRVDPAVLAGMGAVESDHGRAYNNTVDADGVSRPGVFGPPTRYGRAAGPAQMLDMMVAEASRHGELVDVDGDGFDVQDAGDAWATAALTLCRYAIAHGFAPVDQGDNAKAMIHRWNPGAGRCSSWTVACARTSWYVDRVWPFVERYRGQDYSPADGPELVAAVALPPSPSPTAPPPVEVEVAGVGGDFLGMRKAAAWWEWAGDELTDAPLVADAAHATSAALELLAPTGGSGGSSVAVGSGPAVYGTGAAIERGRPDTVNCLSGFRAKRDPNYCAPPGSLHPQATVDVIRALEAWTGRGSGWIRPAGIDGAGARALRSYHKSGNGIDWPGVAGDRWSAEVVDLLCRWTARGPGSGSWCRARGGPAAGAPIAQLVWQSDGHYDHVHVSMDADASPADVAALIADICTRAEGRCADPEFTSRAPRVQYGGALPRHVRLVDGIVR